MHELTKVTKINRAMVQLCDELFLADRNEEHRSAIAEFLDTATVETKARLYDIIMKA